MPEEIASILAQTFADDVFTKSERRAVKAILREKAPNRRERDWLRHQIFAFAQEQMATHPPEKVLNWLEQANKLLLDKSAPESRSRAYFSPGEDVLDAIQTQLNAATKSLDICVFTISDDRLSDTIKAAYRRRIKVRVITDNDKMNDAGSDILKLEQAGIDIRMDRTRHHMHHKFAVIDGDTLLTGSYNWTRSAARSNQENLLITEDPSAVKAYRREFDRLWEEFG